MSVSVTTAKVQYTLSSGAQALPVPFYFIDDTHIKVVRARTGVVDLVLIKGTDYTITGAGDEAGGTVTTIAGTAAALAAADKITIKRDIPVTQLVNYVYNDKFPAEVHERALDKLTMIVQQLKEVTDRAVQFPETEVAGTGNIMPAASGRAAKILGFDASGNAVQLYDPVSAVFAEGDAIYANSVAALKAISCHLPAERAAMPRRGLCERRRWWRRNVGLSVRQRGHGNRWDHRCAERREWSLVPSLQRGQSARFGSERKATT
jgi:hypothetical protein